MSNEKLEELKLKYGLDDDALAEIAGATGAPAPGAPTLQRPNLPGLLEDGEGAFPASLMNAMKGGEMGIMEGIFLMDFMDRKEERKLNREANRKQGPNEIDKVLQEMKEQRAATEKALSDQKTYFEQIILGKQIAGQQETINSLQNEIQVRNTAEAERRKYEEIYQYLDDRIAQAVPTVQGLSPNQQLGFFDTIFGDIQTEIGQDMKEHLMARFRGETTSAPPGEGDGSYIKLASRAIDVLEEAIKAGKERPQLKQVKPVQSLPPQPHIQASAASPPHASPELVIDHQEESTDHLEVIESEEAEQEQEPETPETVPPGKIYGAHDESYRETPPPPPQLPPEDNLDVPVIQNTAQPPPPERIHISSPESNVNDLQEITGIGPAFANLLTESGVINSSQLAEATPSQLAASLKIPQEKAQDWIDQAKDKRDAA
uniref:DUF4332 domain-containing protein n=1 Tax=viral metagenome TaxID=1070528 RepID=A0A6M3M2I3_9ZZZZ